MLVSLSHLLSMCFTQTHDVIILLANVLTVLALLLTVLPSQEIRVVLTE